MIEQSALRLFWTFMLLCAGSVLITIWLAEAYPPQFAPVFFKTSASLFVIGLASFLVWAPLLAYRFLQSLRSNS
jgi:hypothetical protein